MKRTHKLFNVTSDWGWWEPRAT